MQRGIRYIPQKFVRATFLGVRDLRRRLHSPPAFSISKGREVRVSASVKSACRRSRIEAMMGGWQRQQTGVSTNGVVDTNRGGRRIWSEALKRQIVAERLEPGSSGSIVAPRPDVDANQLFKWRRGLMAGQTPPKGESGGKGSGGVVPGPGRR